MAKKDEPTVNTEVEELQQQIITLTDALQRERADSVNLRRQTDEQIASIQTRVKANVVRELLPVIDSFERALLHVPEDLVENDYVKGVQSVVKQFATVLASLDVEQIPTVGEPFDPHFHEAISMEEGDGDQEIVSEELQSGWRMGDEVLRPAMVRVATK